MANTFFGGPWTQEKLGILQRYLDSYTTALKAQPFSLIYVDAFAGEGSWSPNSSYTADEYDDFRDLYKGSATIALEIQDKPFDRFLFIEKDPDRSRSLDELRERHTERDIEVVNQDANEALPTFCRNLAALDRAVVFLDPFATEVSWATIESIAATKKIDCWILFPIGAIARIMPRDERPPPAWEARLNRIFGERRYWVGFYEESPQLTLFPDDTPGQERPPRIEIADRYRERLKTVFHSVATTPRTLLNSKNSPMFELLFAAGNPRGASIAVGIADHILTRW